MNSVCVVVFSELEHLNVDCKVGFVVLKLEFSWFVFVFNP